MRLLLALAVFLLPVAAQTPPGGAAWVTATDLPGVDLSKLTAAQKQKALKSLREEMCTCGCQMRVAECRVVDPPCTDSKTLAQMIVDGVVAGHTAAQIHNDLTNSRLAKLRASQNRILGDPESIPVAGAPVRGPANAKVTLIEFSDFECPYCTAAVKAIDELLKQYPTQVKLIYKEFPLEMHPHARLAAEAALAAQEQGKFWEMHDKLFANSRQLSRDKIFALAKETGLDMKKFQNEVDSGKFDKRIDSDIKDGVEAGVEGTPSLFLDGKPFHGPVTVDVLKPLIAEELKLPAAPAATKTASR
jgi:protein-disulfide isomerase